MGRVKFAALAGAACLVTTASFAADMPQMVPVYPPPPPIEQVSSAWYLRGDIGVTNQSASLHNPAYEDLDSLRQVGHGFDSSPLFGIGLGYNYNSWLRFDVTGEYRGKANFKGSDIVRWNDGIDPFIGVNDYRFTKSEWTFLFNAYVDLGTWWCVTPFVGAGVGFSRNTISSFRDVGWVQNRNTGVENPGGMPWGFGDEVSTWSFAWAFHAGLAYKLTNSVTIELAYRYINLGEGASGDLYNVFNEPGANNPFTIKDITSHDLKFGVRFSLDPTPAPAATPAFNFPPPLMRRG